MKLLVTDAPWNLIVALAEHPEIDLIVADNAAMLARCSAAGLRMQGWEFKTKAKIDPRAIWNLRRAITALRPDIIHSFHPRSLANVMLATAAVRSRPQVVSFRGIETTPRFFDPANHLTFLHPRIAAHACESNAVKDGLVRGGIAAERCITIYNCVRPDSYARPGRAALAAFDVPADAFVVGTVATIRPVKGIDILLEAAIECADLPNVIFLLIGPIQDARVARLARDPRIRDRVRLLGRRPNAVELISGADLFAMPSRNEGLCRALLESMTQQVCPIVSDAGGMKELVRDGIDGVVFPRENPTALAEVIHRLHAQPALIRRYAESARKRVAEFCSPEVMCERTLTIYRRLAA